MCVFYEEVRPASETCCYMHICTLSRPRFPGFRLGFLFLTWYIDIGTSHRENFFALRGARRECDKRSYHACGWISLCVIFQGLSLKYVVVVVVVVYSRCPTPFCVHVHTCEHYRHLPHRVNRPLDFLCLLGRRSRPTPQPPSWTCSLFFFIPHPRGTSGA